MASAGRSSSTTRPAAPTPRSAGEGRIEYAIDDGASRAIEVDAPGLFELAEHPRHGSHRLRLEPSPGVELYSVSFSAGLP